jgi:hypothetical protein
LPTKSAAARKKPTPPPRLPKPAAKRPRLPLPL